MLILARIECPIDQTYNQIEMQENIGKKNCGQNSKISWVNVGRLIGLEKLHQKETSEA